MRLKELLNFKIMFENKESDDMKGLKMIIKFFKKYPWSAVVWLILMYIFYLLI